LRRWRAFARAHIPLLVKKLCANWLQVKIRSPRPLGKYAMNGAPALSGVLLFLVLLFCAIPVGVLIYMFWIAWKRSDAPREPISVQYEPPDNLTPAECGALVRNSVELRSITATITDLSVKGCLTIELERKEIGAPQNQGQIDYIFHLARPQAEWNDLKPHEREVMASLFIPTNPLFLMAQALQRIERARAASGAAENERLATALSRVEAQAEAASDQYRAVSGRGSEISETVAMSDLRQEHFALRLPQIRNAIYDQLVSKGYYASSPDRMRTLYIADGLLAGLVMAVAGGILASASGIARTPLTAVGLFTGAVIVAFGFFMPARTGTGTKALAKVLGFSEFLGRVEKDHIERLEQSPELFEKYLPYAMALGVENRWTQTFANIAVPPPQWFQDGRRDGFLPTHLTANLTQMSARLGVVPGPSSPPN
jgi:Predicted membrane protein (DUF2207)